MFFVELDDDGISIADIKRIAQHIVDDYEDLIKRLTGRDKELLSFILKPTLEADHNEEEIRKYWNQFISEFTLMNEHGEPMTFFYSENKHLYFGDQKGIEMVESLSDNPDYPHKK